MNDGWVGEFSYVRGLVNMVEKYISPDFIMCEVGSYRGVSSEVFAIFCKKLFCVDIWDGVRNRGDNHPLSPEEEFDVMIANYENIVKIKERSSEASKMFENESLDAVYIDGDHSEKSVIEDMTCWVVKVKPGGFVMGHDWRIISEWISHWIDKDLVEVFSDDSWIFRKN